MLRLCYWEQTGYFARPSVFFECLLKQTGSWVGCSRAEAPKLYPVVSILPWRPGKPGPPFSLSGLDAGAHRLLMRRWLLGAITSLGVRLAQEDKRRLIGFLGFASASVLAAVQQQSKPRGSENKKPGLTRLNAQKVGSFWKLFDKKRAATMQLYDQFRASLAHKPGSSIFVGKVRTHLTRALSSTFPPPRSSGCLLSVNYYAKEEQSHWQ